jgi:hypothetical protein
MKDDEIYGLLKVPDEVIIKELRLELGKATSYIQELEQENKRLKDESPEEKKAIRKEKIFNEYRDKVTQLQRIIARLKKENEQLLIKSIKKWNL